MVKVILTAEGDNEGNIWLDAEAPIRLRRENDPPHRIAIGGQLSGVAGVHLRIDRPNAYRLIDQLQSALDADTAGGAEPITKCMSLALPINGGVDKESGEMVFLFKGKSGLDHRFTLPFDQSGTMLEIVERAAKTAGEWLDARFDPELKVIQKVEIQPRETESLMLAEDPASGRSILVVRLSGGHQFSFFLDRKIVEQLMRRPQARTAPFEYPTDPWASIADDIEWFEKEWCTLYEPPSDPEIRRGTAALRRLLVEDCLGAAWRQFGFEKQPEMVGPDVPSLAVHGGVEVRHITSLIAGGATINGIELAMLGHARVDHPETGVSADAEMGFAVKELSIIRDARGQSKDNELTPLINKSWPLSNYLDAPGAVRRGYTISRRDIVSYFANVGGGVHLGRSKKGKEQVHELVKELINKIGADTMDGLFFELLSIGQSIGRSEDLQKLVAEIRSSAKNDSVTKGSQ